MSETNPAAPEKRTFWFTAARVFTWLLGHTVFPMRYYGRAYADLDAPFILVSNHKHWLDPLIIGNSIRRYEVRFLGKKELVKSKIGEWLLNRLHMIVVDRHNSDLKAMRECIKVVRDGKVLGIFPEGTRCPDTLLEHMETGCAFIALRAKTPLLPVHIDRPCKLFRTVHITYGPPIDISDLAAEGLSSETAEKVNERIRAGILALAESGAGKQDRSENHQKSGI